MTSTLDKAVGEQEALARPHVPAAAEAVVVGAGPAGLGAASELRRRGVQVLVLEQTDCIAASWRSRYDGLRLNTSRRLSGLRRDPIPRSAGSWPSREQFIAHLEELAHRHRLDVRFGVEVQRLDRDDGDWSVVTTTGPVHARFVILAAGYDRVPKIPDWPGREGFTGELIHASRYRNPSAFREKDVLVVGAGNTGTEVATQLAHGGAARVRVSMRTPVNVVPPETLGVSATVLARLSENAPDWLVDRTGFLIQRLTWGDLSRYGMPRAPYGVATELRVKGLGAVVDRGFVAALKAGRVELVPAVEALDGADVLLANGERIRPDTVIAGTGYRHGLEDLVGHLGVLLPSGKPAVLGGHTHPDAPGLYFNGYWLPLSGQLPAMRRTSRRIGRAVARARRRPRL